MPSVLVDANEDEHIAYFLSRWSESDINFQSLNLQSLTELGFQRPRELPDIIHLQYLQYKIFIDSRPILTAIKTIHFVIFLLILRLRGVSFVWTAHNVESHEANSKLVDRAVRIYVANLCDRIVVLHEGMSDYISQRLYSQTETIVIPLGDYRAYHQAKVDSEPVGSVSFERFDGLKVGMIGAVRRYKEIPLGIESIKQSENEVFLQIAGYPRENSLSKELNSIVNKSDLPISTDFRFLADADILYYYNNIDALLLLHSIEGAPASLNLAANSGVPIIATNEGMKAKIVESYNLGTVVEPTPKAISEGLNEVLEQDLASFDFNAFATDHSWEDYVRAHDTTYAAIENKT